MSFIEKRTLFLWGSASFLFFLYSFTQVDLSLTLLSMPFVAKIILGFQYIGYFNRPQSSLFYLLLLLLFYSLYIFTLLRIKRHEISTKGFSRLVIVISLILAFSYNAFSYDIFNYIFDAKIVTFYHQNPYIHKALDFPSDPMLSFMHWTHRNYPYGPLWLGLTVPLSFIGNHIFILTFYLFKLLIASFFLLTVWSIGKIGKVLKFSNIMLPVAAFAFNPFVLSESLVSSHNDIVMMGIAMFATYFLLRKESLKGSIIYILSAGVKFATALTMVLFFVLLGFKKTKYFIGIAIMVMIVAVILATIRTTFQPWYLLYIFPFAVLMIEKRFIKFPLYIFSIAAVIYYIPFLYGGNWNPPIPALLNEMMIGATIVSSIISIVFYSFSSREKN